MQVDINNTVSHKGMPRCINLINPIYHYSRKAFNRMAAASTKKIEPVTPFLEGKIKQVSLKNASAWDINPNHSSKYVFFMHGMAQNVSGYQALYKEVINKGFGVLAVEYRGHGVNKRASITEDKLRNDVKKAYQYLTQKEKIRPSDITIMGHSMGGGLAADFAGKHKDIKSLILISPIASVALISRKFMLNKNIGMGIPEKVKNFTDSIKPLKQLFELCFNSISKMKKVEAPTYIIHSKNDPVTLTGGSRRLAKAAKRKGVLKDFIIFPKGGHNIDKSKLEAVSNILGELKG